MMPDPDEDARLPEHDGDVRPSEHIDVPAAFYRDAPPPCSSDDPHWVEFKRGADDLPEWMILAAPAVLAGVLALHGVLAIILALVMHQRLT